MNDNNNLTKDNLFKYFQYLNIFEKIIMIASPVLGLLAFGQMIYSRIQVILTGDPTLKNDRALFLVLLLAPIALRIRIKAEKKIPIHKKTKYDLQRLEEFKKIGDALSKDNHLARQVQMICVIISAVLLSILFGPYIISDISQKISNCYPSKEFAIITTKPSQKEALNSTGSIEIFFNEPINEKTIERDSVDICIKTQYPNDQREIIPCTDISFYYIKPELKYLQNDQALQIILPKGKRWGSSRPEFIQHVVVTVNQSVKSICGTNLSNSYAFSIPIKFEEFNFLVN